MCGEVGPVIRSGHQEPQDMKQNRSGRTAYTIALVVALGGASVAGVLDARERFGGAAHASTAAPTPPGPEAAPEKAIVAALHAETRTRPAGGADAPAWDLPNLDHERVDYFVSLFTGRKRDEFEKFLVRMGHYEPMISRKLVERGMPQDLIYLAMIESGFNPKAYSHAHASGLWQFIQATGRRYGLEVNRAVDERNDPEKATDAALEYLQDLHRQFGSWYLAAAAYNSGEGRVARVMKQVTGSTRGNERSYYRIRSRLPRETRDYVPLMVAAARIAKEPAAYGFDHVVTGEPLRYDVVEVGPATTLASIAKAAGTTAVEIRRLNPQLKLNRTRNDRADQIRIPEGARVAFAASRSELRRAEVPAEPRVRTHRVRSGENLTRIARRYGVSIQSIKRANNLRSDRIYAGKRLRIPT
jgi:membrane-bound lytic murein transglycosylase D